MRRLLLLWPLLLAVSLARAGSPADTGVRIESFTPQGTVKGIRQVVARFSAPMVALGDPRLPAPFARDCAEGGAGRWADPRTWVLDFDRDLPGGIACRLTLGSGLKALDGRPLLGEREFRFDTGGPAVKGSLPEEGSERIDEQQAFLLAVDAPVDAASIAAHAWCEVTGLGERIGVDLLDAAAREAVLRQRRELGYDYYSLLSPDDPEAAMQWDETALRRAEAGLLALRCRRTLPPDTDVRLVWGRDIRSATGLATREDRVLAFKTRPAFSARLRCQRVNPQAACLPMLPLELRFTAEVPAAPLKAVRLLDASGKAYPADPIDPATQPLVRELTFRGPFPERARLTLQLPADLRDDAGRALENAASFPLAVPLDEYPPLAKFSGAFGILEAHEGGVLPVTLRNLEPQVAGQQQAVAGVPGQLQRLGETDADIVRWLERVKQAGESRGEWVPSGPGDAETWREQTGSVSVFAGNDRPTAFALPKPLGEKPFEVVGIPLGRPGFYVVELASPRLGASLLGDSRTRYVATAALVTNLGVHFKWGREGSLVWVTSLDRAEPVADAELRVSDYCSGRTLWQGRTGQDGTARVEAGVLGRPHAGQSCGEGSPSPLFVSARLGDDLGFTASSWNRGIQPGDFNLTVGDYLGPEIVHTILDRPLFRAGETVSMKHVLRRHTLSGFDLPAGFRPAFVEITHAGSDQQVRLPVAMDAQGVAESSWAIPRDARLGLYQVALTSADQGQRFESGAFHVEQFRLPTMKAVIQPPAGEQVNPGEIPLDLYLAYLSGGGAAQAPVKLHTLAEPRGIEFKGYEDYIFGGETIREGISRATDDAEVPEAGPTRRPAEVLPLVLDAQGAARTRIKAPSLNGRAQDLLVEMDYQDANGEVEAVTRRIPLWPATVNLGVRTDGWIASPDGVRLRTLALDLKGQPVAGQPVEVTLFARKTYSWRKRLIGGFYAYDNRVEVTRLESRCEGRTDTQGLLLCELRPGVAGEVLLQARTRDRQGNEVSSATSLWIAGEDDTWFEGGSTDRIDLIPERQEYQPGETARFQVRMPFRQATALVTVEREGVAEHFVTALNGKSPTVEVPMLGQHAPNAYVSVLAVRGRVTAQDAWWSRLAEHLHLPGVPETAPLPSALVDLGKPAYRLGNAEVRVGWQAHRLDVRVEPAAQVYRPRETARVRVHVGSADGAPLPADTELALAAVDEALLELKPNPSWRLLDGMMATRPIEVYTATAQMQVVGKRHYGRKAVPHGGGGGRQAARELFDTLLLWRGRLPLNGRDAIDVDIPLNDSLSAFRVVAVAQGGLGRFGTGSGTFRTSQPLMLDSGLPPVVREGDRLSAIFTVRNAGEQPMSTQIQARVSATPAGAAVLPVPAPLAIDIPPGGAREAVFALSVPAGVSRLDWSVSATDRGGQGSDLLKVGQAVLPAMPVRTLQATLEQLAGERRLPVQQPAGAMPGRGGIRVALSPRLGDALAGVTDYMRHYPYSCLEQKVSVAVALRDRARWGEVLNQLSVSLDPDGLLRYFPSDRLVGSDSLTSYVLAIADEAGWPLPERPRERMLEGLKKFVGGRLVRASAIGVPDLTLRKLSAIEALARHGEASPELLDSLTLDPNDWPTSALLDWLGILQRVEAIPGRATRQAEAEQILRTRLTYHGTTLGFSTEDRDRLGWLMRSPDQNAVRLLLMALDQPGWQPELPKLVRGALGRQRDGRWNMTTANAWGVLAMERFGAKFESAPVTGQTEARLGDELRRWDWSGAAGGGSLAWPLPEQPTVLRLHQQGTGKPWAVVQVQAALPLTEPLRSGFGVRRSLRALEQKRPGVWTRGDTLRVTLELEAQSDSTWVVVDDPVPAGATILGRGLGGESTRLTRDERSEGQVWPAWEERRQDAYRAYYPFVPKGRWTVEYTVRLNNPGTFVLPPTHVEALYAPEMFADAPNAPLAVLPP